MTANFADWDQFIRHTTQIGWLAELVGYGMAVAAMGLLGAWLLGGEKEYAQQVKELADRSGEKSPFCKRPD